MRQGPLLTYTIASIMIASALAIVAMIGLSIFIAFGAGGLVLASVIATPIHIGGADLSVLKTPRLRHLALMAIFVSSVVVNLLKGV